MARRRKTRSIAALLNEARVMIENSLGSSEIMEELERYGYHAGRLEERRARLEAAGQAVARKEAAAGDQQERTQHVLAAKAQAVDAYQALAKVARAVFRGDHRAMTSMELQGRMPLATAAFLSRAYRMFDNALQVPEIAGVLQVYGYDRSRLQSERARIHAYDLANQAQEAAKGDAQQASAEQRVALSLLQDWFSRYRTIARVALRDRPQLLAKLGIPARSSLSEAQRQARRTHE